MEALFKLQTDKRSVIERARINFKKSSRDRLSSRAYVSTRLESLEHTWNTFLGTHNEIIQKAVDSNGSYFTDNMYESTEELYIIYKSEIKEILERFSSSSSNTSASSAKSVQGDSVKLPKIEIPKFSGHYAEWPTFKDLFLSLIHSNKNLDDVQRMHYLKGLLKGEAEQLLRHMPITASNYQECWSLLKGRYDNKRFLSNCLLRRLMNQSTVPENSNALKGLLDTTMECLNGLRNLGIDVSTWDILIIYIISDKLDPESRKLWETQISSLDELPKLSQFKDFLEARFRALEFLDVKAAKPKANVNVTNKARVHHVVNSESNANVDVPTCAFCKERHKIHNCKSFARESYDKRQSFVQNNGLCFNCLGSNHSVKFCRQTSCRICKRKHHSLLHPKTVSSSISSTACTDNASVTVHSASTSQAASSEGEPTSNVASHLSRESVSTQVLLATALVKVPTRLGSSQLLRVLMDQGSQASFITESAVQLLGLKKTPARSVISGIGGERGSLASEHTVNVTIHSHLDPKFSLQINAYVLRNITSLLPSVQLIPNKWPELEALTLADPAFHTPNKIDILLGADAYGQILREGLIQGPPGLPVAQNTALGWILSGKVSSTGDTVKCHHVVLSHSDQVDENAILKQFWEVETVIPGTKKILSEDELRCERIFTQTTLRDENGRYVVNLPFRDDDPQCQYGSSRNLAVKRFLHLENKFKRNPEMANRYSAVFHEYIDLGHVERVPADDAKRETAVYLPHHAVVREEKSTTKVRIVFDASMKGLNGRSLNDDLMVGPTLQLPLRHIIMRWRTHPISLCADVTKMYRQVKVSAEHVDFQRVVWRDTPESEIEEYKLMRVTFGTASAPYLAVKSLQQTAVDEGARCPDVSEKIKKDFYVDDLMTGCNTVEEGLRIYKEITDILTKGGFPLQKWVSSCEELNREISEEGRDDEERDKDIKLDEVMKFLGISWDRKRDEFKYSVNLPTQHPPITKRKVISDISRLFDPLGWAAPCVVTSKIFIQRLWLSGIGWDDELTPELLTEWRTYRIRLFEISRFCVPRWVKMSGDDVSVELQGFSDASTYAYSAVVYLRVVDAQRNIHVSLLTARTKVAPVKQQSVPKLELMGAVLLSELIYEVAEVMKITHQGIHLWTDSTVVLAWLSSHPSRWTTFVGNRVSTILSLFDNTHWAHVQSSQNPADIASRGITPQELSCNELWAQGPSWLKNETIEYKRPKSIATNIEARSIKSHVVTDTNPEDPIWTKFSTLTRLVRVIAYCRRVLKWKKQNDGSKRYEVCLQNEEIEEAMKICIKHVQNKEFKEEINDIKRMGHVKIRSKLKSLCPMVDDVGILRVSGRIDKANLEINVKRPIILPHSSHFTNLVIDDAHKKTLHGGPTLVLNQLRTRYWIITAKSLVKSYVRKCVKCRRYSATTHNQLMGQLPSCRITPARPFRHSGVDFAGPISIRTSKGRGHHSYKGYICVFVCMVSKAIHLEAISDLSAQGFIAGFKRLVARRGSVAEMWSDNGTNFVGAAKELRHLVALERSSVAVDIREWVGNNGTSWHFIPPHAPNFGGIWEAGVKSTKGHLRRVIGDSTLTYEELATVLAQIEACLNSRPLSVLPDSPDQPLPLTPGHFLVGEPLITVPDRNYEDSNISSLRRWQLTQRMMQCFWRRWSTEYLTHMLQRYKWTRQVPEPSVGDVVLVKEDGLPPARWLLGRVVVKHPGDDHITRVVTLKCNGSLIKRPTSKLCVLPVNE